jgi:hypothetical protein
MKYVLIIVFGILSNAASAARFDCRILENLSNEKKMIITATVPGKHLVYSSDSYVFYINASADQMLELEVFLPNIESRIYSKGNVEKELVSLTVWQRDAMLEFNCRLLK